MSEIDVLLVLLCGLVPAAGVSTDGCLSCALDRGISRSCSSGAVLSTGLMNMDCGRERPVKLVAETAGDNAGDAGGAILEPVVVGACLRIC